MKKLLFLLALSPALLLLTGCPIGLDHAAGTPGTEKIDKELVGTWTTEKTEHEFKKVTITAKTDYSYTIEVFETGELYALESTEFTAWTTTIKGKKFLYALPSGDKQYYLYHYEIDGDKMLTHDVGLLDGGTDAVTSTETLRSQIETSLDKDDCLSEETEWKKK